MKAFFSLLIACSVLPMAAYTAEASPMVMVANDQTTVVDGNNEFAVDL